MTYDLVITTTAQHAAAMLADRDFGHRSVMQLWGQHGPQPRAELGILWAATTTGLFTDAGLVHVRCNTPPEHTPRWQHDITTTPRHQPALGDHIDFHIELVAEKSPSIPMPEDLRRELKTGADGTPQPAGQGRCWRPKRVTVPDDELHHWAHDKLARNGFHAEHLTIQRRTSVHLARRRARYPTVHLHAHGTITDPTTWHHATTNGIGKGKAFGIGLIRDTPNPPTGQHTPLRSPATQPHENQA